MAFTSQVLGAVLQVDGRATEGGILEIVPGARLLLDVGVDSVEGGALLDDIATAVAEAKAARDEAVDISGISTTDAAVASRITTPGTATQTALSATIAAGVAPVDARLASAVRAVRKHLWQRDEPLHPSYPWAPTTMPVICIGQNNDGTLWGVNQATNKYATSTDNGATWTDGLDRTGNPTMTSGAGIMDMVSAGPYAVLVNDKGQLFRCAKTAMFSAWGEVSPTDARAGTGLGMPAGTTGRVHTFATNDITTGAGGQSVWLYGNYNAATLPGPGAMVWRSLNYGSTWTRVLNVAGARHLHAIAFNPYNLNQAFATIGDSVESAVGGGLYVSNDAGATWTKASGNRYGISIAFVPADAESGLPARVLMEGDGVGQAHIFSYDITNNPDGITDPAVWFEDQPATGASWKGSARAICVTPKGNVIYSSLAEGGATGTRDGLWIARGPHFENAKLLQEYTGGTIPSWRRSIISGDYFINGTIRNRIPRFRDDAL